MISKRQIELTPPNKIVEKVTKSGEFLKNRHLGVTRAFGKAAIEMSRSREGITLLEAQELRIAGLLPAFLDATDRLSKDNKNYRYRDSDLKIVIHTNHALRELIDANQKLTMSDVKDFVAGFMLMNNDSDSARQARVAKERVGTVLHGMRHEIAAENTFWKVPGVDDVRQATVDEDKRGVDLVVDYKGRSIPYDIKASQELADRANRTHMRGDYMAIYSGYKSRDFGDSFRVGEDVTLDQVPYYQEILEYSVNQDENIEHIA